MAKQNGTAQALAEVGELPDYRTSKLLAKSDLAQMVRDRQRYEAEKDAAEALVKDLNGRIADLLEEADLKSVRCGHYRVTRMVGRGPSHVDKTRLLELGVSADLIVKATIEGKPWVSAKVTELEEK